MTKKKIHLSKTILEDIPDFQLEILLCLLSITLSSFMSSSPGRLGPYQKRKFHPLLHRRHHHQKTSSIFTIREFLKPIHFLLKVLTGIRHRITDRNVPRLRKCKERMELAIEYEEGLDEEEGFSAGLVM
jgi:hypothetical protein